MAEIREFKTESKRLLDLMIHSIYTNREIFLRELISNASDANDKHHFLSLTDDTLRRPDEYQILLEVDKEGRKLSVIDNDIGMTYEELIDSLGTIAKSGSSDFMDKIKDKSEKEALEIIGQFGVGFYSAFMVSDVVEVRTKSPYSKKGYLFRSEGIETYAVEEVEGLNEGTKVTLFLRKSTEEEGYDEYLEEYALKRLVKKYSDYIRYPIRMEVTKSVPKLDKEGQEIENEYEQVKEIETLNSMTPIWRKPKQELSDEDLNAFYKQQYYDYQDPLTSIYLNVEGALNYKALIYIPKKPPFNLYSDKYEKGLQLYSKGVFIMDKCKELVPDYMRFIRGLVDSSDLPLNISREVLQKNREIEKIATNVEKKIISKLENLLKNEKEQYLEFFEAFGVNLKYGVYDKFGEKKELLENLLIYKTIKQDGYLTLKEYVDTMEKDQEFIYYASGKTKEQILALPQMDLIKSKGYDVLVLTEEIDEFVMQIMQEYEQKKFKSINQGDLDLLTDEEEKKIKELSEDKKSFLEAIKAALPEEVTEVILSKRLTTSPVCLVSADGLSFEMEKYLNNLPTKDKQKAKRILEINPNHQLFSALERLFIDDDENFKDYAQLLYSQALLIEGLPLEDPVAFSDKMTNLLIKTTK
ncbi:MAG: molecular chaperone HtpG [Bacilli bacterium]|nr:molecular chaperone HtpG [Bacilli bacterium]